ncbi:hypothetical protein Patl1_28059 [Pistacia atlantica]|uniref:Uncharacterized protein n=1 Tax=Pistacia atlantica TaxID=434234 RepID=A0ACC1BGM5_9ROSI|nr:hypothetical protein Patl1_28059 [Pistacia atlantica]
MSFDKELNKEVDIKVIYLEESPTKCKRSRLARTYKIVNRPYGDVLSRAAVRERIIQAFLVEEQKIVRKVLKIWKAKEKQASRS